MNNNPINNNNINIQNCEDGIDLRDLIMVIWKRKVVIISLFLSLAIIGGLFSKFILSPAYDTILNIAISMPESYITKFGEYKLPIATNEQYINFIKSNDVIINTIKDLGYDEEVTVEDLKESIAIGEINTNSNIVQNSFDITVSAETPKKSLELAQTLYDNYIEFLNVMMKERAISYFYNEFNVKIETARNLLTTKEAELKKNEELLKVTPQTINQKEAMSELQGTVSDYVVLENIINPNYTSIEKDIILNKQDINNAQIVMEDYSNYIKELTTEKSTLVKYYETGDIEFTENSVFDIVDVNIYLPSNPVAPTKKTSPSNVKNAIIGGLLGGMLGVMIVFFTAYWKKEI